MIVDAACSELRLPGLALARLRNLAIKALPVVPPGRFAPSVEQYGRGVTIAKAAFHERGLPFHERGLRTVARTGEGYGD